MEFTARDGVHLRTRAKPIAGEGEVLVKVTRVGICGTDIGAVQRGNPQFRDGIVIGHELVGVRQDTGQRVTVIPLVACGACRACIASRENLCAGKVILGAHIDGVLAEYVALPAKQLVALPDDVDDAQAALIEPMATALHALRRARVEPASRVAVIGGGAIGLCLLVAAREHAKASVYLTEIDVSKHGIANSLGAEGTGTSIDVTSVGLFDAVFDTVGAVATRENAIAATVPGGPTVFVGLHSRQLPVDGNDVVTHERTLLGSFAYDRGDFLDSIDLVKRSPADWVTEVSFAAAVDLINGTLAAPAGTTKLHVRF
nr:L-galactonate-5-dehydrogenase [Cryobacterium sp. SO1]